MKKILQIISVFLLVFLVGCSEKEGSKVYVKKQAEKFGEKLKGIKGLEDKVDYQDKVAIETVTVDYSVADINELKGLPWPSSGDKKVSLKKTEEKLIEERFDEKK